jgi:hypothetical protein
MSDDKIMAQLNDISQMLERITSGQLKEFLKPDLAGNRLEGCTGNCDCKGGYCGCNSSVTAFERFGAMSYPEFLQIREARIRELQQELRALDAPK